MASIYFNNRCTVCNGGSVLLMPIHLSPEGLSVLGICAVKMVRVMIVTPFPT
jgi:hypothetical protein